MTFRIACIGNIVQDIILRVEHFPIEDTETRIPVVENRIGGNVANTMSVLKQFGLDVEWLGILPSGRQGSSVTTMLDESNIKYSIENVSEAYSLPTSYILLNRVNGTRTILHNRSIPEMNYETFRRLNKSSCDWLHVEARNPSEQIKMLEHIRRKTASIPISLEIEKVRDGYESLLHLVDHVFYSKAFAEEIGYNDPESFLVSQDKKPFRSYIAWGAKGAGTIESGSILWHKAPKIRPVDTIGAGDVLNAGFIFGLVNNSDVQDVLKCAVELATRKCQQEGLAELVKQSL